MTDIVARLEGPLSGINRAWVLEAADAIKQLRVLHKAAEARESEALNEKKQDHILMTQTVRDFEADNKELRAALSFFIWVMDQKLFVPDLMLEAAGKARRALEPKP